MSKKRKWAVLIFLVPFIFTPRVFAENDRLTELENQVKELQKQNELLRATMNEQQEFIKSVLSDIEELQNKDIDIDKKVETVRDQPMEFPGGQKKEDLLLEKFNIPRLNLRGFAEVGLTSLFDGESNTTSFVTSDIDLFITSEISDRVSYLFEADFHSNDANTVSFGLQRSLIKYSFSDLLNVKIGRIHTPLGYWNETFHHGSWLQTPVSRPEMYTFERDSGGFLPVHAVGADFLGQMETEHFDFAYNFDVLNGRGRTVTEVPHLVDYNDSKALNLVLGVKPHMIPGLDFGPTVYWDQIPKSPGTAGRAEQINELIVGGHVVYMNQGFEFLAEYFNIYHDDRTSGKEFTTRGGYVQGAYSLGQWKPYYRFDAVDVGAGDPYFTGDRQTGRIKNTFGLRWDAFKWNAIKLEISNTDNKGDDDEKEITINSSFAF